MAVSVSVFNTGPQPLSLIVNGGSPIAIAASGASINWQPQQPTSPPTFTGGNPVPGGFGYGTNQLVVTVDSLVRPQVAQITIPPAMNLQGLQLYLWCGASDPVSWLALNNGIAFAQGAFR